MVKITNVFGDEYTGVQDNAIYQKVYGKQVRRKRFKETKPPSQAQLAQRQKFKDAINYYKSLSSDVRRDIRNYFVNFDISSQKNSPKTWYTYVKFLFISTPTIKNISASDNLYLIKHPAILTVQQLDSNGNIISVNDNLTDFSVPKVCKEFQVNTLPLTAGINVITYTGFNKLLALAPITQGLIYCDINYCDPNYCE